MPNRTVPAAMADVRTFVEVAPGIKDRLRTAIEALVDVLDSLEPDADIEENGDDELTGDEEPRLGATTGLHQGHARKVPTDEADEAELSLGWVGEGQGFHGMALPGYAEHYEEENEHGGDVNDVGEPSLGARINDHDQRGWASSDLSDGEADDDNGIADMDGAMEQAFPMPTMIT
jgi:hypothetical protein